MTRPDKEINSEASDVCSVSSDVHTEQFTILETCKIDESCSLQDQLDVVLEQYKRMKSEICRVMVKHIPEFKNCLSTKLQA